ncbi:MAG: hypothetical protein ACRYF5_18630, partial [Janthinobacterium lividum]
IFIQHSCFRKDFRQLFQFFVFDAALKSSQPAEAASKQLKALSICQLSRMISGFPLPTLVLTPGWAIF